MPGVGRLEGVGGEEADGVGEVAAAGAGHGLGREGGGRSRHCPIPRPRSLPRRGSGTTASPAAASTSPPGTPKTRKKPTVGAAIAAITAPVTRFAGSWDRDRGYSRSYSPT